MIVNRLQSITAKDILRAECLVVILEIGYFLTKSAVAVSSGGGPLAMAPAPRILVTLVIPIFSLLVLDLASVPLKFSKITIGLLLAASIFTALHLQLIATPYDCTSNGCGYEDGEFPADSIQVLALFWLVNWLIAAPFVDKFWADKSAPNLKRNLKYSLIIAVPAVVLGSLIYMFMGQSQVVGFVMAIISMPFTILHGLMIEVFGMHGSSPLGYVEWLGLIVPIQAATLAGALFLASLQSRPRWIFTAILGIIWLLCGDTILTYFYAQDGI